MAKFVLEINLGNDSMQTKDDIEKTLSVVRDEIIIENEMYIGENRRIYDINGNSVGHYGVI